MAGIREKRDGDFYLAYGYPVFGTSGEEGRFAGFEVLPRAQLLLHEAGLRGGSRLPELVFYALLLEGEITNCAVREWLHAGRPAVTTLPYKIQRTVAGYCRNAGFHQADQEDGYCLLHSTLDIFRHRVEQFRHNQTAALIWAAQYYLSRRWLEWEQVRQADDTAWRPG